MKKKHGGLDLVDPEVAKTSLLCKWIVKEMKPGESNLQLMLRHRLARFNAQRRKIWRVNLDWFTNKKHQGVVGSKVWGHIGKIWKVMVKCIYQILSRTHINYFTQMCGSLRGWPSLIRASHTPRASSFIAKISNV